MRNKHAINKKVKEKISCRHPVANRSVEALEPPLPDAIRQAGFRGARYVRGDALAWWERGTED